MEQSEPRLVILRGNCGAGKTSLAVALQHSLGRGTANIGQDHLRRVVLREHDVAGADNIGLIDHTVRYCLGIGYHVVLEGILLKERHGPMLTELVRWYTGRTHVLYLDVSLEQTLARHEGRPLRSEIPPEWLRDWFVPDDLLGVPGEVVIDGSDSFEVTLDRILTVIGPVPPRRMAGPDRFF